MSWRIISDDAQSDPEPEQGGVGWLWPVEDPSGARKGVLVRLSAEALEAETPSEETEAAKATNGRSVVEKFLDDDNPPGRIVLDASGIVSHDEQVDAADRPSSAPDRRRRI